VRVLRYRSSCIPLCSAALRARHSWRSEASAYTAKEIDDAYNAFISKVKAIDKGEKPAVTTVATPVDDADEAPFDLGENTDTNLDGMDWMKNFQ
jgi:hypothetical protein